MMGLGRVELPTSRVDQRLSAAVSAARTVARRGPMFAEIQERDVLKDREFIAGRQVVARHRVTLVMGH